MDIESARLYCLAKEYATEDMPFGDDYVVFRIGGKIFAGLPLSMPGLLVLKCDPAVFDEMTERYAAIQQAWHWHKRHWMQIQLDSPSITDELVCQLTDEAYALVRSKLTRKVRESLGKTPLA